MKTRFSINSQSDPYALDETGEETHVSSEHPSPHPAADANSASQHLYPQLNISAEHQHDHVKKHKPGYANTNCRENLRSAQWVFIDSKAALIRKGQRYGRWKSRRLYELATIDGFFYDGYGILHVVYHVTFVQPAIAASSASSGGSRMIAFSTFAEQYAPETPA